MRSLVAYLPPSSGTIGLSSGGITGSTSRTIHSGLLPERRKDSTISRRLIALIRFCPVAFSSVFLSCSASFFEVHLHEKLFDGLCAHAHLEIGGAVGLNRFSVLVGGKHLLFASDVAMGSSTTKLAKFRTCSKSLGDISSKSPILLGTPLKYQMWLTGAASSMSPCARGAPWRE